jgi:hypothetical protein
MANRLLEVKWEALYSCRLPRERGIIAAIPCANAEVLPQIFCAITRRGRVERL